MSTLFLILLVCVIPIGVLCVDLTTSTSTNSASRNCHLNLKKVHEEHAELKSLKEKESFQAQSEIVQFRNEIESLKTNLNKLSENLVHTQQKLSLCASSNLVLSSHIGNSLESNDFWANGLRKILNTTQIIGNKIKAFQQRSLDKSLLNAQTSELKLAHNIEISKIVEEFELCQSSALPSCLSEHKILNDSWVEMVLNASKLQTEISDLKTSDNSKLNKEYENCQTNLSSCVSGYKNLNASLPDKSSWAQCKIHIIPSSSADRMISAVVDVQLSKDTSDWDDLIFNGTRFLTYSTWKNSGCSYDNSTFIANGWYDTSCKMVWKYDNNVTADVGQNGLKQFRFKLVDQVSAYPKDCVEIVSGKTGSGVYNIYPSGSKPLPVYCDMSTDGGGWTVILQRGKRGTIRENFYRNWTQYENGFGDVVGGDYNIGLKNLFALTSTHDQELRVELSDWQGNLAYATYKNFRIGGADEKYKLTVGNYSGNAGNALEFHNGKSFSTFDQDNDLNKANCAAKLGGAWWYNGCLRTDLNGKYSQVKLTDSQGITWWDWKNKWVSLKSAEMKIRRINFDNIRR